MTTAHRKAFITGGESGIGRAIALRFAKEGYEVVIADIIPRGASETVAAIRSTGGRAHHVHVDVADEDSVNKAVSAATTMMGRVDILANVAGTWSGGSVTEMSVSDWDRVMAVNARGVFLCSRAVLPQMMERRHGVIINLASVSGLKGTRSSGAYNPSKAAVIALTKSIALDYAPYQIRVNAICPGAVAGTAMNRAVRQFRGDRDDVARRHPLGRERTPEDIAGAALYFASDDAAWVTGTCLVVDGGFLAG